MAAENNCLLDDDESQLLRDLVAEVGEQRASQMLHVSRGSIQRLLARLPARRGTVALVRQRLAEPPQSGPTRVGASQAGVAKSILLIENDATTRHSICQRLEREGYEVQSAESGHEALHVLPTVRTPCLVLADMLVPDLDVPALVRSLASGDEFATLPVIMSSSNRDARDRSPAEPQKIIDIPSLLHLVRARCHAREPIQRERYLVRVKLGA